MIWSMGAHVVKNRLSRYIIELMKMGIITHIALQTFLNIAVVSGLVPATGISLPFFSYGGTALVMQLVEMGIMLNISQHRYYPPEKEEVVPVPEPDDGGGDFNEPKNA